MGSLRKFTKGIQADGGAQRELREHGERAFSVAGKKRAEESWVAELERKVGQRPWRSIS
jgi:hypothetical protein